MKVLFVDAYNVINSWSLLSIMKDYNFDAARQKLIDMMQNYAAYRGCRVFIVFDGHKVPGNLEKRERMDNVVVVFTKEGETADNFIEKSIDNLEKKVDVTVVTSDAMEQLLAFQRGATRMSSLEFYNEVVDIRKNIEKRTEKKFSEDRNLLEDRVEESVLEKLEKIRRSR